MSNNTIIKQGVDFEYQVINKEQFFKFLNEELTDFDGYDFEAFLREAQESLNIGNACYELHAKYTKSCNHAHYDF